MLSYRPSSGYYRRAIRSAKNTRELEAIALALVRETEHLRSWARELGLAPPHFEVTRAEAEEKHLGTLRPEAVFSRARICANGYELRDE